MAGLYSYKPKDVRKTVTKRVRLEDTGETGWLTTTTDGEGKVIGEAFQADEQPESLRSDAP